MSCCRHGVDFAEYTVCSECDREEIDELESRVEELESELIRYKSGFETMGYMSDVGNEWFEDLVIRFEHEEGQFTIGQPVTVLIMKR